MKSDFTNSFILNALNLPVMKDLNDISYLTGLSNQLLFLLSQNSEAYYKKFYLDKKNGGVREINSPSYSMKLVQRWILSEILEKVKVSNESMAFKKDFGNGSIKNARYHQYSLYILQLDLERFFDSIDKERIFLVFKSLGYNTYISHVLTNICTLNGTLPQGGVCSPYLSNLICYKLDRRLTGLCSKRDVLYTRYADDLTFSCDNKQTLKKIKNIIEDIIIDENLKINHFKTRLLSPGSHKKVNGITVNNGNLKASKELKKKVRAMIHHSIVSEDYSKNNIIRGYVSYINSIEKGYLEKMKEYIFNIFKKDYNHFSSTVNAFNENKLYRDIESIEYVEFVGAGYSDDYEWHNYEERRFEFLVEKGYLKGLKDHSKEAEKLLVENMDDEDPTSIF